MGEQPFFVQHPFFQSILLTLRLAFTTTCVLLVIGIPLAHWLNRARWTKFGAVMQTAVGLPIVLPPTVIGFYLLVCFAPSHFPGSVWLAVMGRPLSFFLRGVGDRLGVI